MRAFMSRINYYPDDDELDTFVDEAVEEERRDSSHPPKRSDVKKVRCDLLL